MRYKGKMVNPNHTTDQAGIEDWEFLELTPKMKGGSQGIRVGARNLKEVLSWRNTETELVYSLAGQERQEVLQIT